jgi:hypothetical protein
MTHEFDTLPDSKLCKFVSTEQLEEQLKAPYDIGHLAVLYTFEGERLYPETQFEGDINDPDGTLGVSPAVLTVWHLALSPLDQSEQRRLNYAAIDILFGQVNDDPSLADRLRSVEDAGDQKSIWEEINKAIVLLQDGLGVGKE